MILLTQQKGGATLKFHKQSFMPCLPRNQFPKKIRSPVTSISFLNFKLSLGKKTSVQSPKTTSFHFFPV